jgi:D-glycero-beta-D-manno-heptose-7-phosphate kinase
MFPSVTLQRAVARFAGKRVVVVGDLIADEYLYGKPARISREAPVLILRFTDREVRLGGAANAAHNVHALGAHALSVGVLGADAAGDEVQALYRGAGIPTDSLLRIPGRSTPIKTRIMAGGYQSTRQQVVRLDREPDGGVGPEVEARLVERLDAVADGADAFLVSAPSRRGCSTAFSTSPGPAASSSPWTAGTSCRASAG